MTTSYTLAPAVLNSKVRCSDCKVDCQDASGKSLGLTGGAASYGQTVKSNLDGYARKAQGMIRRDYFRGAVKLVVTLTTWDSETQTRTTLAPQTFSL